MDATHRKGCGALPKEPGQLHRRAACNDRLWRRRFASWAMRAQAFFNLVVDSGFGELRGNADCVLNCSRVRGSVADDADALEAQKGSAAVFGVVEAFLKIVESTAGEEESYL